MTEEIKITVEAYGRKASFYVESGCNVNEFIDKIIKPIMWFITFPYEVVERVIKKIDEYDYI